MKKRKMLSLALALALIMSLVPVSGLAAEPAVLMDPGAIMQEDTEEAVYTEAVNAENGEEIFSPDADEAYGQEFGQTSEETGGLPEETGADQTFGEVPAAEESAGDQTIPEMPAAEESGADQVIEEVPPAEGNVEDQTIEVPESEETWADQTFEEAPAAEEPGEPGADQTFEEAPAAEETGEAGADQTFEEAPAAEETGEPGADQAIEETPVTEETGEPGADQTFEEAPAVGETGEAGADQAVEETPVTEETGEPGADQAVEETSVTEETGEPGADQAVEETPVTEETGEPGADQTFEGTPETEETEEPGADQAIEETPVTDEVGADQAVEETPVTEETEEPAADQVVEETPVTEETEEPAADQVVEETPMTEETEEPAADQIIEETPDEGTSAAEESVTDEAAASGGDQAGDTTTENEVEDGFSYVLMNIPYADFYAAELAPGSAAVDAVSSSTLNKPRTGTLAGGSYHVDPAGTDISGVIYPVKTSNDILADLISYNEDLMITDDSVVSITVTNRGKETTTEYYGRDALFEAPDYSFYITDEVTPYYKELTVDESGNMTFGPVTGDPISGTAQVSVTANASHTYYEMSVTSDYVQAGDQVSAVVLTADDGSTYGLRHIANMWRGTELGFNADEPAGALSGKKITGIRYYKQDGVYDLEVDAEIPQKLPEYVLMNIPYADFYAAELAQGSPAVDAVTSATMSKPRSALANGSYHVNIDGTDISGVVYPVKVGKGFQLDPAKQITDDASLSITVTLRGNEVTTEYHGRETLFEAPDYSWYALSAEEVPEYYKEARTNHGNTSFGPAVGAVTSAQAAAEVKAKARHADYEIKLTPDEGVLDQAADVVNAVVLTDSEGNTYGLRHVANIWRVTEVGFNRDEPAGALAGKKITNIRYYLKNRIIDLSVDIDIPVLSSAVSLDKTSISLLEGKTAVLTAAVDPAQAGQAVNWSSSDENVVTVDQNGLVTAVAAGTATVTAEAADNTGASAVCQVTVTKPVSAVTLDKTSASVFVGKTVSIKATVTPDDAGSKALSWTSSDKKIATVDAKGVVKGIAKGTATITATAKDGSGVKASCKITVRQPVTKITLSKTSASILKGKTVTLKATAAPASANNKAVTWTTSNKKVATVTSKGIVKGIAKGTATITAAAKDGSGVKASCKVTVKQPVTQITLSKTSASILKGKTVTLKATAAPALADNKAVTWTTSNNKIATVDAKGVVKGIAKGTATITATAKDGSGIKASCKITVRQPVTKITLSKTSASILKGKTVTLKATAAPASANNKTVTWTTSNKKIATVTSKGVVKGIAKGTATITATAKDGSGVKASCKITVKQPVTKLTINKTKLTVKAGKTAALKVTVAPSNANNKSLRWTSSNQKIATVTQNGVVKGIKRGTVTITAAAKDGSGKKVTCKVTVQ